MQIAHTSRFSGRLRALESVGRAYIAPMSVAEQM